MRILYQAHRRRCRASDGFSGPDDKGDAWIIKLNFFGLVTVGVGILNAEFGLFGHITAAFANGEETRSDDVDGTGETSRILRNDKESQQTTLVTTILVSPSLASCPSPCRLWRVRVGENAGMVLRLKRTCESLMMDNALDIR